MEQFTTWRAYLGQRISDTQEKQRLADAMGVNSITLTRWASTGKRLPAVGKDRERRPRPQRQSLRKLVEALPADDRAKVIASILQEFPDLTEEDFLPRVLACEPLAIPTTCYEEVLEASALLSGPLRMITIFDHLLDYALLQLDSERLGISAIVVRCNKPLSSEGKVRSLREQFRMGTPPWKREREERNSFLGAESLAGQAVMTGRSYEIDDIRWYSGWLPLHQAKYEVSVAVCPIQRRSQVAGCLIFSSTQPCFFTRERTALISKYGHLAQAAFEDTDYYDPSNIELRLMPSTEAQEPILRLFNKHVEEILARGEVTNRTQAEALVMHQIEDDLIYLTSSARVLPSTEQHVQERTAATR
jgi:hypothetical protein